VSYIILVREPYGKRSISRLRHRWEENVKMNLKMIDWEGELVQMEFNCLL
jgi:hypothetical protein